MSEQIEHIVREPTQRTMNTPLMLMHGAWHGAWCWENWLGYFAELGYEVHAISLPGHGESSMTKGHINRYHLKDYVNSLAQEIETLDRPPVLIGHSMGGAITQMYLEKHTPAAAVLLASIPQKGLTGMLWRTMKRTPWLLVKTQLTLNTSHLVGTQQLTEASFFTPAAPIDLRTWHRKLVRESFMITLNGLFPFADANKANCPVLVQAGEKDAIFTVAEERHTAERYKAKFILYQNQGHNLMAEPEWQTVADDIDHWVRHDLKLT